MWECFLKFLSPQCFFLHKHFCSIMIGPYMLKSLIYLADASFNIYINKLSRETLNNIWKKQTNIHKLTTLETNIFIKTPLVQVSLFFNISNS